MASRLSPSLALAALSVWWLARRIWAVRRHRFKRLRDVQHRHAHLTNNLDAMTCKYLCSLECGD